jgi:hypothetical protein
MFSGTAVVLAVDGDSVWVKDADGTRFTQNASSVTVKPWVIEVGTVANLQWATLPVEVLFIRGDEAAVAYLEQDLPSSEMFVVQLEELLKP